MWLNNERKYSRKSLRTRSKTSAIEKGRNAKIKTHLQHFLDFIGKDSKLKELERIDCDDYFYEQMKKSKNNVKQDTIQNKQSTINSCMKFLFRNNQTHFEAFDFKKLFKVDRNNEAIRRATLCLLKELPFSFNSAWIRGLP